MSEQRRVYIVEDDPSLQMLIQTLLEMEGYEVSNWVIGDDPFEKIIEYKPDIVLMDVNLKGKNGFDVLKQVHNSSEASGVRVIMLSGMDFSYESKEANADGFLLKPFMPDEMISLIAELLLTPIA